MTKRVSLLSRMFRRYTSQARSRARILKRVAAHLDLVYFGAVDTHHDDLDPIRGFTASLSHVDSHFIVGSIDDYDIRLVDRFDVLKDSKHEAHGQTWCIIEVELKRTLPPLALVPTGVSARDYQKLFSTHHQLQPINTMLLQNHSLEVHGRFQILAPTGRAREVEEILTSPLTVGIASRFWPQGIEVHENKLFVYITEHRLSAALVESTIASAVWLAHMLDEA